MFNAWETKNGKFTIVIINNKLFETAKSIIINVKRDESKGKIVCYDVDQYASDEITTKRELIELFSRESQFDISIIDQDPDNEINTIIKIKECKCDGYTFTYSPDHLRMIIFEITFNNRNIEHIGSKS